MKFVLTQPRLSPRCGGSVLLTIERLALSAPGRHERGAS